jgi:uncharacterized protein (DUF924 family)
MVKPIQSLIALAAMSGVMFPTLAPASDLPAAEERTGGASPAATPAASGAKAVVAFWREAGPALWFAKDPAFDRTFRERFLHVYEAAARGELGDWVSMPESALALVLLLDQFPRNAFRGTPRMYATDVLARTVTAAAISAGHDAAVADDLSLFFYLPFAHSEDMADQNRSVALCRRLGQPSLSHAEGHREIIRRFGRFPHRNPILGRPMRPEEQRFLDEGGFAG